MVEIKKKDLLVNTVNGTIGCVGRLENTQVLLLCSEKIVGFGSETNELVNETQARWMDLATLITGIENGLYVINVNIKKKSIATYLLN